jgi:glycosyltransferase involved in cell wall biosynthesis
MLANGFITWAAADLNAVHFVHSAWLDSPVHTARISSGPSSWYQWLYTTLNAYWERRAFRDASMLVAVSERVRDELIDIGVDAASIRVIPNGVDLDEFAPGPADRAALGLVENVPLALFVGDLQTPRKNLDTVLHMLQHVPDLHVAIVGDARNSSYPSLATTLGLTGRVSFLGYRTDVPRLFRAVDMCLCPSRYEPFSLVVLEALASGCPVITSRCVGATSVLTPSCGAVIDEPDDALALAGAVQSILDSDAETMRTAARSVALQYSWDRTATAYLKVLHRLGMSARSHAQGEAPHSPPTNRAHPAISPSPSSQP